VAFSVSKCGRQTLIKFMMKLTKKFGGADLRTGHLVCGGFHPILRLDVGQVELLKHAPLGVGGKLASERGVNVARLGAVAFDEVRVIAVHRADQRPNAATGDGVKRAAQPFRSTNELEAEFSKTPVPVFGQQRLHVGRVIEKVSQGHDFADYFADV
jgi:hypothetical protein